MNWTEAPTRSTFDMVKVLCRAPCMGVFCEGSNSALKTSHCAGMLWAAAGPRGV